LFGFLARIGLSMNEIWDILWMGYNLRLCDFKSLVVIWDSRTHMFCCSFFKFLRFKFHLHSLCGDFFFFFLGLYPYVIANESYFGLDMVYHLRYFHIMFCMCGDNNNCRHWYRSAQQICLGVTNLKRGLTSLIHSMKCNPKPCE